MAQIRCLISSYSTVLEQALTVVDRGQSLVVVVVVVVDLAHLAHLAHLCHNAAARYRNDAL